MTTALEILAGVLFYLLLAALMCSWTMHDLEKYSDSVIIDPKTGKVISRFKDWLEGREK